MAFDSDIVFKQTIIGSPKYKGKYTRKVYGTFTNTGGGTGGDVHPGLTTIKTLLITPNAQTSTDNYAALTSAASGFTITVGSNVDGFWEAMGYE